MHIELATYMHIESWPKNYSILSVQQISRSGNTLSHHLGVNDSYLLRVEVVYNLLIINHPRP